MWSQGMPQWPERIRHERGGHTLAWAERIRGIEEIYEGAAGGPEVKTAVLTYLRAGVATSHDGDTQIRIDHLGRGALTTPFPDELRLSPAVDLRLMPDATGALILYAPNGEPVEYTLVERLHHGPETWMVVYRRRFGAGAG